MAATRGNILKLVQKKDDIEREIKEFGKILDSRNVGLYAPLVDAEGYPRLDIDIYQVRHARHKIICLQNDHKAIMKEIEEGLGILHAQEKTDLRKLPVENDNEMQSSTENENLQPIVRVDKVMEQSPAEIAGLVAGDRIVKFGSITPENFRSLQDISSVVQHSVGRPILLMLLRNGDSVSLTLTPSTWQGRGLIGCNLMPV